MMSLLILSILHTFSVFIVDFEQSIFAGCGVLETGKKSVPLKNLHFAITRN